MIRPNSLIRGDDPNTPQIEADAINIRHESLDCGITAIGCCNTPKCQKIGTAKLFLTLLIFIGIFQGAAERYFQLSLRQAALEFGYHPVLVDWLSVTSGILTGVLAIFIAYWGNHLHRISWIGALILIQGVSCLLVIIPIVTHNSQDLDTISATPVNRLCTQRIEAANLTESRPYSVTTLICLFILQFGIAMGNIVFHTLGLSYIDDNVHEHESPALIGAALAAKLWGVQWGSAISIGVSETTTMGWWLGWTIIGPILFILAIGISLFPKKLLSSVVRQAADNIIERATNNSQLSLTPNHHHHHHKLLADTSFGNSMKRMITNKILVVNVLAAVFIETAIVNFFFHEQNYLQSRFYLPAADELNGGITNVWTSRLLTNLLKPIIAALAVLIAGLIIAKAMPNPRKLAAWNIITATVVACLFIAFIFIDCTQTSIAGAYNGRLTMPYCSHNCVCPPDIRFNPVCPADSVRTFYSACHAGCSSDLSVNGQRIFGNCSCGIDTEFRINDGLATEGACGYSDCQKYWIIFQVLTVFGAALLASGLIGNLILSIRSVLPQDKSLALSMELWLFGLIVYIPGKIGYRHIADSTCQYFSPDNHTCYLHESPLFGNILNIVTASLIAIGIFFDIFVFIFVKDMILYGDVPDDVYRPIQMQPMNGGGGGDDDDDMTNINRYNDVNDTNSEIYHQQQLNNSLIGIPASSNNNPPITSIRNNSNVNNNNRNNNNNNNNNNMDENWRSMSPTSGTASTLTMNPSNTTIIAQPPTASGNVFAKNNKKKIINKNQQNDNLDFRLQTSSPQSQSSASQSSSIVKHSLDSDNPEKLFKSISPIVLGKTYKMNKINNKPSSSITSSEKDSMENKLRELESPISSLLEGTAGGSGIGSNSGGVGRLRRHGDGVGVDATDSGNESDKKQSSPTGKLVNEQRSFRPIERIISTETNF